MTDLAQRFWGVPGPAADPGDLLYVDEFGRRITVRHFTELAESRQAHLTAAGARAGDVVVCAVETSLLWLATLAGLWLLGAVPVVGRSSTPRPVLDTTARRIGASHVLVQPATGFELDAIAGAGPRPDPGTGADRLLFGQLTSGSTGEPKVVGHNRSGVAGFARGVATLYGADRTARILTAADISFGYGFGNTVLIPILTGAAAVLWSDPARTEAMMGVIDRESVTIAALSPRVWAGIARKLRTTGTGALGTVTTAVSAGEPLPDDLRAGLEKRLRLSMIDGYGATEILHIVATRRSAADGFVAVDGMSLGVATTPAGQVLAVTGPMVARPYLHAPPADRPKLTGGTFVSGDAVHADGERLTIVGRADFLLNRGGVLCSPVELEAAAWEVLGVESVAAEVDVPGTPAAKLVLGVVDPNAGRSPIQLGKELRARLAGRSHLAPDTVTTLTALPLTATGKLDRRAAAGMLARRVGSTVRWRSLRAGPGPAIVLLPCAGASADFYQGLASAAKCAVSAVEIDPSAVTDLDELIETIADYLHAETDPGDRLVGHSLGAAILAAAAAVRPDAVRGRTAVTFCPPPAHPTAAEFAALARETDRMLAARFTGQPRALDRARRRVDSSLSAAAGWLDRLGKHLATFPSAAEVSPADDSMNRGADPITMCHNHIRVESGGHYLPLTDPLRALDLIAAVTPAISDNEEIA
ncbi:AMP-binding protein [Nocardia sp. NPDC020380]|uniref:AMP-binding protein n=1 Tax=Nocardia sp. NPDC020380 TaxID=3364309 RepID=UPI003793828B